MHGDVVVGFFSLLGIGFGPWKARGFGPWKSTDIGGWIASCAALAERIVGMGLSHTIPCRCVLQTEVAEAWAGQVSKPERYMQYMRFVSREIKEKYVYMCADVYIYIYIYIYIYVCVCVRVCVWWLS